MPRQVSYDVNHSGIFLLSIGGKILAGKILLNCLNVHPNQAGLTPESQCGFRKDRWTIDMIFTARPKKCQEQYVDLYMYMTFVDLTKAFDTFSRDGLWKFDCPPRFIATVCFMITCRHTFRMMASTLNYCR